MNMNQAMRTLAALGNPPRASYYPPGIVRMLLPLLLCFNVVRSEDRTIILPAELCLSSTVTNLIQGNIGSDQSR